jgi:PhnB protein
MAVRGPAGKVSRAGAEERLLVEVAQRDPRGYPRKHPTTRQDVKARLKSELQRTASMAIPEGSQTLTPYLVAQGAPALIDFVKQVFGAKETVRATGSAGGIHCEVRIGDSKLMMGGGEPGLSWRGEAWPTALHVYVEDPDAVYQRALQRAFEAEELEKYASPGGVVLHARIRLGDSILEMGEAHGPYQPMPTMFYLYMPDVDATYRRALDAGAVCVCEPADQPYGDRRGAVADVFGNQWYIATPIQKPAS